MAIVEVRPIEKERWHKKTGKEAFARPITIEAGVDLKTGKLATGLSKEDRERLEAVTGYDLSPEYNVGKPHPFYHRQVGWVKLEHKTNVFDTSIPVNEIKVKLLKESDLIANSMKEFEEGKFPQAMFVIYDEQEEVERKASKLALKNKVVLESAKLSFERKAEIVQILMGLSVRKQTPNFVDLKLDECIDEYGSEVVLNLIKRDKARTSLHALVLEGIYKNVLRKEGTAVYYMDDQLGYDVESAVDYFADAKNQTLKAIILEKIS